MQNFIYTFMILVGVFGLGLLFYDLKVRKRKFSQ